MHFLMLSGCLPLKKWFSDEIPEKIHDTLTNQQNNPFAFVLVIMTAFGLILVVPVSSKQHLTFACPF